MAPVKLLLFLFSAVGFNFFPHSEIGFVYPSLKFLNKRKSQREREGGGLRDFPRVTQLERPAAVIKTQKLWFCFS